MRLSRYPVNTAKETPADAEVISHQLMLRAGLIRRLAAGIYTFLPMGLRAVRKVEKIIREEMDRAGAYEMLMPAVQPAELWQESARWEQYGPELLRFKDRHDREFVIGPTAEEVITDVARRELKSYRQLPVNFYQIQMKFRDEIRPRFGVMRGREFLMKDAYSFHADQESLAEGYAAMKTAYTRMFERMGLTFRAVRADTGSIGGSASEEFQVLADSGEDAIAVSDADDYAANLELAPTPVYDGKRPAATQSLATVPTPATKTIADVSKLLGVDATRCVKTLIVEGSDGGVVAMVIRGDHEMNAVKAQKVAGVASPLRMATAQRVLAGTGTEPGFLGPVGLKCRIVVDHAAAALADFVCGANARDAHLTGVNWGRDLPEPETADLRNVVAGDPSPSGQGKLAIRRGIEVGHIFQLGRKYSEAMQASVLDPAGKPLTPLMGCYGIGVTRVVAAAIEQNHDDKGIIWPDPIAPYTVLLVTLNHDRSEAVRNAADSLYAELGAAGIDVLYDDRDARPGVKFADAELLGIPHCVIIGDRGLAAGQLEYRHRRTGATGELPVNGLLDALRARLA
ncbi:MAG: proline--tRNA ligase [Proteobacteria bacterium]|nr:proline--tRNA ligase [Pseudomonadota bacterium]MBK7116754.1 proline--tRNA ligase [Pseudomonadota bacterium]MBK9251088.1 proline--tRNA ligase [Pseudomonadota bacterium]MCC6632534.1 proline--tRNA ligase [Gammaproteobacteria bacterium]